MLWKEKRVVCLLPFTIHPEKAIIEMNMGMLAIVADYNRHMGHVDNGDRMANSYRASHQTWKWTNKAIFPPVRPGHCQQLRPFICMWWEENPTHRFSTHPYQRDSGTGWA
jgi:hypothetical protein